jgi:hypothetical protein
MSSPIFAKKSEQVQPIADNASLLPPGMQLQKEETPTTPPLKSVNVVWPTPEDIQQKKIKDKNLYQSEVERTWYWLQKIIRPTYLPNQVKDTLLLMPDMEKGDDWIICRYGLSDMQIQIIDGRTLTLVLKPLKEVQETVDVQKSEDKESVIAQFAAAMFRKVLWYDYYLEASHEQINLELSVVKDDAPFKHGQVLLDRGRTAGWLQNGTIKWWSDGKVVVFDIEKIFVPPTSKLPFSEKNGELYVGGIAPDDPRTFVRFDPAKKIDFGKEFVKVFRERTPPEKTKKADPNASNNGPFVPATK